MENLVTMIIVWVIANTIIGIRFAVFSGMDKKMVIFSLVMVNIVLGGILMLKGFQNINESSLLVVGIILVIFMFMVYYNHHNKK